MILEKGDVFKHTNGKIKIELLHYHPRKKQWKVFVHTGYMKGKKRLLDRSMLDGICKFWWPSKLNKNQVRVSV
jgi:hypothetical protein